MAFPLPHFPFFLNKIFSCWIQDVKVCTLLSSMGFQGKQPFSNITDIRKNKLILVLSIIIFQPSVQFSCSVVSHSLWPHGLQHARPPCPSPTPGVYSNSYPLSWWCCWTISSFSLQIASYIPSSPAFNLSQHQGLFQWVSSSHQVAKVLEFQLQHQSF